MLDHAKFIQIGHGQRESNLKNGLGYFKNSYTHHAFEKGLTNWFIKHIKYAEDEAKNNIFNSKSIKLSNLFSQNIIVRRRIHKIISSKLPLRGLFKFIYMYVYKLGFLDGKQGFIYVLMQCIYEQIIQIKEYEIKFLNKKSRK